MDPGVRGGTSAESEVVSFCWEEMQGAVEAGAWSLCPICRSLTGRTALAGWQRSGIGSAEWEELFVALSWISPSSLSDKATESGCSPSLHKSRPAEATCPGGFCSLAEQEWVVEDDLILE